MPTLTIDKFYGLHDGTPEQPGFASKCENFWITEHGKLSRRGGVSNFSPSLSFIPGGDVVGIFTVPSTSASGKSSLNDEVLFWVTENGKMYYRSSADTPIEVLGMSGLSFFDDTITNVTAHTLNDLTYVSYEYDSGSFTGKKNFILFHWNKYVGGLIGFQPTWTLLDASLAQPQAPTFSFLGVSDPGSNIEIAVVARVEFETVSGNTYQVLSEPVYATPPSHWQDFLVNTSNYSSLIYRHISTSTGTGQTGFLDVYATQKNGSTFYKQGSTALTGGSYGFISPTDTDDEILYIQAGEVTNTLYERQGHLSTLTSNGVFWNVDSSTGYLMQSKPYQPGAWPGSFNTRMKEEIIGLSSVKNFPIVFTTKGCYRVEGFVTADGAGTTRTVSISETITCMNNESILRIGNALLFMAADGFYETDGYAVRKVSKHINKTYFKNVGKYATDYDLRGALSCAYDHINQIAIFVIKDPIAFGPKWFCIYPDIVHPEGYSITTVSGGTTEMTSKLCYINHAMLFSPANSGRILGIETSTKEVDPDDDDNILNSNYDDFEIQYPVGSDNVPYPIEYDYLSTPMSFGSKVGKKYISKLILGFNKLTQWYDLATGVYGVNDYQDEHPVKAIRHVNTTVKMPVFKRNIPSGYLRCVHKQVGIRSEQITFTNSDAQGLGYVDNINPRLFIVPGASFPSAIPFVDNYVGYYLYVESDNFSVGYPIAIQGSDSVECIADVFGPAGVDQRWEIRGYPKNMPLLLDALSVEFTMTGDSNTDYTPARGGELAD